MTIFFRTFTESDIDHKMLGKFKKYRLTRGDGNVVVKGTLLRYYNVANDGLGQTYLSATYVDRLALFRTGRGKFVVYYIIEYVANQHQEGKRQYVQVFESFEEVKDFVSNMQYVNKDSFEADFLSSLDS